MNSSATELSNVRELSTLTGIEKIPLHIPSSLHVLLMKVKEIQKISSFDQVLDAMKDYIFIQKLFDPKNPRLIHCQNDELGSVLGMHEFSLWDIKKILWQKLLSENYALSFGCQPSTSACENKRKAVDNLSDLRDSTKKSCLIRSPSPMILFIPTSPKYDSSSETNLSIQGYETAFVKDTSDEPWISEEESSDLDNNALAYQQMYEVEYEVESLSSGGDPVSDSDSEIEDLVQAAITTVICKTDSDMEFWADDSCEDDFESDLEISGSDNWKCSKCESYNKPPMRYCQKCWDERIGWLPDGKKRRQPPRRKCKIGKKACINVDKLHCSLEKSIIDSEADLKSETANSAESGSSQELFETEMSQNLYKVTCEESSSYSQEHGDLKVSVETISSSGQECSKSPSSRSDHRDSKLCILCCAKPKNATIVHGKIGHQLSCYRCARRLLSENKPCPWCRRSIDRVIHQIVVA